MLKRLKNALKDNRGNDLVVGLPVIVVVSMMVLSLAIHVLPVFTQKQQMDMFADKLCRTAEIAGRVGPETALMAQKLTEQTGLHPEISWSCSGSIQLGSDFILTLKSTRDIGFFTFGSFPVALETKAKGISEVYWK